MKKVFLFVFVLVASISTQAARTVNVVLTDSKFSLSNPSSVSVSYSVACYTQAGAANVTLSNQTLAANQSTDVLVVDKCAGGTAPVDQYTLADSKKAFLCSGSNSYTNAVNSCGAGQKLCNIDQSSFYFCTGSGSYWLAPTSSSFEYTTDYWSTTNVATSSSQAPLLNFSLSYDNKCRTNSSSVYSIEKCAPTAYATTAGAVCCPATISLCKVTINSTDANAYLASPQFKGGAPF